MRLQTHHTPVSQFTAGCVLPRCPYCGDRMVAPITSEFVNGTEIRHHWQCEACGRTSHMSLELAH